MNKKILTLGLATVLSLAALTSCGGGNVESETESKLPLPGKKMTRKANDNIVNDVKEGVNDLENDFKQKASDMKNSMEDATHGTARQDGRENDTEAIPPMPMHKDKHRPPVPMGK